MEIKKMKVKKGDKYIEIKRMYIDGKWQLSSDFTMKEVVNIATEEVIAITTEGTKEDVKNAMEAARRAFYEDGWEKVTARERGALLLKVAERIMVLKGEFIDLELMDNGKSLREVECDIEYAVTCLKYYSDIATKSADTLYEIPNTNVKYMVEKEINEFKEEDKVWNYPLFMAVRKIAPALADGKTIVFKPSPVTTLSAIKLFEVLEKVGYPKGVVNLVLGTRAEIGQVS